MTYFSRYQNKMKPSLRHIMLWLLLIALFGGNAINVAAPDYNIGESCVAFEAQKSSVPTEGKVEKTEFFKVMRCCTSPAPKVTEVAIPRCFEDPRIEERQIFQPVLLPPPKAGAWVPDIFLT
jgi:hypothetical protein